ncbi:MAG: metallophosphoesterase family protein [Pseudomonadota bacterium]
MTSRAVYYAVGDIHGRLDLLNQLLDIIAAQRTEYHADRKAVLLFVGDYVDRGPDCAGVINRIRAGLDGFETICLKGNHEAMMINCLVSDKRDHWLSWIANGGDTTLHSYGYDTMRGRSPESLRACIGEATLEWLRSLKRYHKEGDVLFVHAGVRPGTALEKQRDEDLLWIRRTFLNSDKNFGFGVVHGHTPVKRPDVRANRINIDTGAVYDGALTAVVVDRPWTQLIEKPVFLQVHHGEAGQDQQ